MPTTMHPRIPPVTRFLAVVTLAFTAVFFALHIGFWIAFDNPTTPLDDATLLQAFSVGVRFDLRLALLVTLPLMLLAWPELPLRLVSGLTRLLRRLLRPTGLLRTEETRLARLLGALIAMPDRLHTRLHVLHPLEGSIGRHLARGYLILAALLLLLFYIADFGHFSYLQTRIEPSILRFLGNLQTSARMVWESYPVIWLTLALLAVMALLVVLSGKLLRHYAAQQAQPLGYGQRVLVGTLTFFLVFGGLYGKFSAYPLRWSDAYFSNNAFAASLSSNPVIYFYYSYQNGGTDVDEGATREIYPQVAAYLGVDNPDSNTLDYRRHFAATDENSRRPNVVMVITESLASYKTGLSGNPLDPSPNLDRLAAQGIYFNNIYTSTVGTARGVFASITGIPDIQPNDTASRNPTIADQYTLVNAFEGYEKFYFLGGSANWANIRGLLAHNIHGLNIYEEGSYSAPNVDVWGVSDLDLFREANQVLSQREEPFFAIIQTSGNHRPYTIPADNAGFEYRELPVEEAKRYGFHSVEEYNAFRFMDHSFGEFIRLAHEAGYADNTIFAFFGDHGISGYTGEHTPPHLTQLGLGSFHTPFVIYAPGLIEEPQRIAHIGNQVDVLPTLAAIAGQEHENRTLGRNLLDPRYSAGSYAFTIQNGPISTIGVLDGEYYFRMSSDGREPRLYRLNTDTPSDNLLQQQPERAAAMRQMTRGLFETARYMINNNHQTADNDHP